MGEQRRGTGEGGAVDALQELQLWGGRAGWRGAERGKWRGKWVSCG